MGKRLKHIRYKEFISDQPVCPICDERLDRWHLNEYEDQWTCIYCDGIGWTKYDPSHKSFKVRFAASSDHELICDIFGNQTQLCPHCGAVAEHTHYSDGEDIWDCPKCGNQGETIIEEFPAQVFVRWQVDDIAEEDDDYSDIYLAELEKPEYCEDCNGPFPDCWPTCPVPKT